jgi:hypothetical protein
LAFTGFGVNAEFPDEDTMTTETVLVAGVVGAGVDAVGTGAGAAAVGDVGVEAEPPPQFQSASAPNTAIAAPGGIECRIQ